MQLYTLGCYTVIVWGEVKVVCTNEGVWLAYMLVSVCARLCICFTVSPADHCSQCNDLFLIHLLDQFLIHLLDQFCLSFNNQSIYSFFENCVLLFKHLNLFNASVK